MEDVLTETPPPSRFQEEDLNNFAPPSAPIPSPFVVLPNPKRNDPIRPSLLIVALSSPSVHALHHIRSKIPAGALVLPEIPFAGNSLENNIYTLDGGDCGSPTLLVSIQSPVPAERAHAVSKLLVGGRIVPERVLIFGSIQCRNFRARLAPDEAVALKLETSAERRAPSAALRGLGWFPSGSVVEGLSAALLSRCEMRNVRGTLCVTWPESGTPAVALVRSLLKGVLPGLDWSSRADADEGSQKRLVFDSELYT